MDPVSVGTTARIASSVARPIIARLFVKEGRGAGLVEEPVRVSRLVGLHGEKRRLSQLDLWKIARELVQTAVKANPYEPPLSSAELEPLSVALASTLGALGELDMDDVQAVRLGHRELARRLAAAHPGATRDLSADATYLHDSLLDLSCLHILHFFTQRSTFVAHAQVAQTRMLDETLRLLDAVVERIPRPGSADEEFERRYLAHLEHKYGKVNIFGLDLSSPDQARWPLDTAYLSLELTAQRRGIPASANRYRVEDALSDCSRAMLRGAAGSGKTTLLQWLAVSAAQNSLPEELAALRGRVPFMLPLRAVEAAPPAPERFLGAVGNALHGLQPERWADRVLSSGRGMVLIDGVDEVSESERPVVRRWLLDLVDLYPRTFFLVTSRPSAVGAHWLTDVDFTEFNLLPMNRSDVDRFVHRWHDAVSTTTVEPEEKRALEGFRDTLRGTLRQKQDLYRLATNPLMCALICALHRDRLTHLPERRMELYAAALNMLLVRRDKERAISVPEGLAPTEEAQVQLLQRIAYWLIRNGRSEAAQATAVRIIREKLPSMPQMAQPERAEDVFQYLLLRSGLLREPSVGTVDFIHRTFQDYLGAKAAVEDEDLDLLAESGRDDQWEDVIGLAVGHARDRERGQLLQKLVELGDRTSNPKLRRRYHLLAAVALEHATTLDPAIRAAVTFRATELIPPETAGDAEHLAMAGDIVLSLLPGPEQLSPRQARATVMTIARIGGEAALEQLARFRQVPEREVRQEIADSWPYFDARSFAQVIFSGLPMDDLTLSVASPEQAACLGTLRRIPQLSLKGQLLTDDVVATVASLNVHALSITPSSAVSVTLPSLARLDDLRRLTVKSCDALADLSPLAEAGAEELDLHRLPHGADLGFLAGAARLRTLRVSSAYTVGIPATALPQVTTLHMDAVLTPGGLPDLTGAFPSLTELTLRLTCQRYQMPVDVTPLRHACKLGTELILVGAGKIHGLDAVGDRVTVRREGRRVEEHRSGHGIFRRFRS
ncbi:NACHT domain-containing protein [Streptomyces sp. NPDC008150]|uniref:NACHT domain-containing protein n=1 Tax=Streptomyces sp. NPDC008150 TaxID=3364816 RepID=UPI0036DFAB58